MKILFLPNPNKDTPYLNLMATSLSKLGHKVIFPPIYSDLVPFSPIFSVMGAWKPNVVHMHWVLTYLLSRSRFLTYLRMHIFLFSLSFIKAIFKVILVWEIHDEYNHDKKHLKYDLYCSRYIANIADQLIVHSASSKKKIIDLFRIKQPSKIKLIPHGSYCDAYPNTIQKEQARKKIGIAETDFVFLFFGKLLPYKGILKLIDAFNSLNDSYTKLIIAGKPANAALLKELRMKCAGNERILTFFEFIPYNEVQIFMNSCDVVVLPYHEILTSGVTILAMSFEKPVIAPNEGPIVEMLPDSQKLLLYDARIKDDLKSKMELSLKIKIDSIGEENFERVTNDYNWDKIANMISSQVYLTII